MNFQHYFKLREETSMRDRREEQINQLIRQIERLTLEQGELSEVNRELQNNQENLAAQNRILSNRVRALEAAAAAAT